MGNFIGRNYSILKVTQLCKKHKICYSAIKYEIFLKNFSIHQSLALLYISAVLNPCCVKLINSQFTFWLIFLLILVYKKCYRLWFEFACSGVILKWILCVSCCILEILYPLRLYHKKFCVLTILCRCYFSVVYILYIQYMILVILPCWTLWYVYTLRISVLKFGKNFTLICFVVI